MYEPPQYSSDSQDEEDDDDDEEEEDITDYEGYNYEDDEEEGVYDGEESELTDEDYYEREYSDEEPEIVCSSITTTTTSSLEVKLSRRSQDVWGRVRRRVWDLMVIIIAFCVAVMLGLYSMM